MSNSAEAVKRWRKNTKAKMVAAMGSKCQCCGYNSCNEALAFHHIDPTIKDMGFGDTRANPKKWEKLVEELKKCILVCHNCHSEIHAGVRELPSSFAQFDENFADWRKVEECDSCPVCNKEKSTKQKFCSPRCAQTNRRKVNWDEIDLLDLLSKYKISELETMLEVSNAAIYKRRDKILKEMNKV